MAETNVVPMQRVNFDPTLSIEENMDKMSFRDVVSNRKLIDQELKNRGGELDDVLEEAMDMVAAIERGKVDRLCVYLKHTIPGHIEALKEQINRLKWLEERLTAYATEVIEYSGGQSINGDAWRARIQRTPGKLEIDADAEVPVTFKNIEYTITAKFSADNQREKGFWESMAKAARQSPACTGASYEETIDKNALKAAVKPADDQDGLEIKGVRVTRDWSLRLEAGKAKPKNKKGGKDE